MGIERKRRSVAFAKKSEHRAKIRASRTVPYANLACEGFLLCGLLCALTGTVKQPTVIHAADAVAFHPAGGELRAAMRAAKSDDMRGSGLATVERKTLAHDLDRFSLAGAEFLGAMDGMPEPAHKVPGKTPWPGGDEIFVAKLFMTPVTFTFGCCHKIFSQIEND